MPFYRAILFKRGLAFLKYNSIILFGLLIVGCQNSEVTLLSGVSQDVANKIILQLGVNNIQAEKVLQKEGSYTVQVIKSKQIAALNILNDNGLPAQNFVNMGEVFKKDSFISSPIEEQGRFIYSLEQQISNMILQINGVVDVKTQVSLPPTTDSLWQSQQVMPAAAVFIKYKSKSRVDLYVNRIKQLVANSVPGLSVDKVEVLAVPQTSS